MYSAVRKNDYGTWNWNYETHQKATGFFLYQVSSFNFFIAILVIMRLLSTLLSVTVKLKHQSLDIISAYEQVNDVQNKLSCLELILMRNLCFV